MRPRILILTSLLLLVGCQSNTAGVSETSDTSFVNEELGITMDNTVGWEQTPFPGVAVAFLSPPDGPQDAFRENVNLVTKPVPGTTADEYDAASLSVLQKLLSDLKVVKSGTMTINGQAAHTRDMTYTQGQYALKIRQAFFIKNDTAYVLTYTADINTFNTYEPDGMKIVSTLKVN